ncbi:MAG: hypothetical protein HC817_15215 [Saprospiraceae bacterium]|nr:hypothetical protein [Saprospiraceae bacterium]
MGKAHFKSTDFERLATKIYIHEQTKILNSMRFLHATLAFAGLFLFSTTFGQSVKSNSQTDSIKADSLAKVANDSIKWAKMFQSIDNLKTQLTPKGDSSLRIGQFTLFKTNRVPTYKVENKPKTPELQKDKTCDCAPKSNECACREKPQNNSNQESFFFTQGRNNH